MCICISFQQRWSIKYFNDIYSTDVKFLHQSSGCLPVPGFKDQWITCQKHRIKTSTTHIACGSKQRSVVRLYMHPFPGNWLAIGRAVAYYTRTAHSFSAEIKCWHCTTDVSFDWQLPIRRWGSHPPKITSEGGWGKIYFHGVYKTKKDLLVNSYGIFLLQIHTYLIALDDM